MSWISHSLSWLSMPCKQLIRMILTTTKNIILLVISWTALGHFMSYFVDFGSRTLRSRHDSSTKLRIYVIHALSFFHSFITEGKSKSYRNCENEFQKPFSSAVCPGADDPEEINPGDPDHSYKFVKTAYSNCTHVIGSVVLINMAGGVSLVSSFFLCFPPFLKSLFWCVKLDSINSIPKLRTGWHFSIFIK